MAKAFICGQMVDDTRASILTIENKGLEFIPGLTVKNTRDIGKMAFSTAREFTSYPMASPEVDFGKMGKDSNGMTNDSNYFFALYFLLKKKSTIIIFK
jgi:hypothetical protein